MTIYHKWIVWDQIHLFLITWHLICLSKQSLPGYPENMNISSRDMCHLASNSWAHQIFVYCKNECCTISDCMCVQKRHIYSTWYHNTYNFHISLLNATPMNLFVSTMHNAYSTMLAALELQSNWHVGRRYRPDCCQWSRHQHLLQRWADSSISIKSGCVSKQRVTWPPKKHICFLQGSNHFYGFHVPFN